MWIWQALTGLLLVILLAGHMVAQHFIAEGGLRAYREVMRYVQNPFVVTMELLFLVSVVAHALMGVRSIVLDLGISERADRHVKLVLIAIGALMVAYGLWLTYSLLTAYRFVVN